MSSPSEQRAVWTSAIPTVRYAIELIVVEKDDTGRGTAEVGEDMLKCGASGLEVTDLVRQIVAVQEAAKP